MKKIFNYELVCITREKQLRRIILEQQQKLRAALAAAKEARNGKD